MDRNNDTMKENGMKKAREQNIDGKNDTAGVGLASSTAPTMSKTAQKSCAKLSKDRRETKKVTIGDKQHHGHHTSHTTVGSEREHLRFKQESL